MKTAIRRNQKAKRNTDIVLAVGLRHIPTEVIREIAQIEDLPLGTETKTSQSGAEAIQGKFPVTDLIHVNERGTLIKTGVPTVIEAKVGLGTGHVLENGPDPAETGLGPAEIGHGPAETGHDLEKSLHEPKVNTETGATLVIETVTGISRGAITDHLAQHSQITKNLDLIATAGHAAEASHGHPLTGDQTNIRNNQRGTRFIFHSDVNLLIFPKYRQVSFS